MKRIILFFAVCLGLSVVQTTFADDAQTVRATTKRNVSVSANTNTKTNRATQTNDRKSAGAQNKNQTRTNSGATVQRAATRTPTTQNVKSRENIGERRITNRGQTAARTTATRTISARPNENKTQTKSSVRSGTNSKNLTRNTRAAQLNSDKINDIKSKDYSKCKTVYFECMDEFCANKDANLRRCACSSRIHEFDNIKKQLSNVEDKMLDFNQRLLLVSLDKEDAAAVNIATEGETAYQTTDTSESEKLLKKITDSLNTSGDSRINNKLSSISLSLDVDTAWDGIDSMSGAMTATKTGINLYNSARPICLEMAKEVCSDDELNIAQNSYKLTIQQDCETVAKSYKSQYNSVQEKIHESSALLDMARLDNHQQRNSDDILTCKKKVLEQLSDSAVCGENLYKCLDTTGQYINPASGQAFLSTDLYNLTNLLQEPTGGEKWSNVSQNESFVSFLNSKKEFLEPAIAQCEDISDTVWKDFLDDALAQIKLAQNAKLEEIRQSCTTLVAECKTAALKDLSEFDTRALSTFNVISNSTADAMCSDVETSCTALMNTSGGANLWESGIAGLQTDMSYAAIIDTCAQIGRDCIIQQCNGTSGNFALCQNVTDNKRSAILTRDICWDDVYNCVIGANKLENMNSGILSDRSEYYKDLYSTVNEGNVANIPEQCTDRTDNDLTACLITEQIWGNCEFEPTKYSITTDGDLLASSSIYGKHNKILIPTKNSTLLSWFANNTGTTNAKDSCNANRCPIDYTMQNGTCVNNAAIAANKIINVLSEPLIVNDCDNPLDVFGNCCVNGYTNEGICVPGSNYNAILIQTVKCNGGTYTTGQNAYFCPNQTSRNISLYCLTTSTDKISYSDNDGDRRYVCPNGVWILIDEYGNYFNISGLYSAPRMTYFDTDDGQDVCRYSYDNSESKWKWVENTNGTQCTTPNMPIIPTDNEFSVEYTN